MRLDTSALPVALLLVSEALAPVVLVDALVAPIVLLLEVSLLAEELGEVLEEVLLGVVLLTLEVLGSLERDVVSVELDIPLVEDVVSVGEVLLLEVVLLEGLLVLPYVELVPLDPIALVLPAWLLLVVSVLDVGLVEAVVFRLPLVFSFVVLVVP